MPSPSAGATATVPASTPSNTCGPSASATQLRSWNMSESDLPIDPTITIQAETSLVDPDTLQVHREPDGASRRPVLLRRPETRRWVAARRAVVRAFWRCLRAHRRQRGDRGEGARRLLVRAETGDRNGSPDATAHGSTGHPRGYCQGRHTRADRRREPGSRSATPGPGSQPFHRCPRRADLDRRRPGREPLHRHERRVTGMLGIKGDPAPGVRGDAAQGRAGDREYRRHDGPRSREYPVLPPHRVEPGSTTTGAPVAMSTRVPCQNSREGLTSGFTLGAHDRPPFLPAHGPV